MCEADYETAEVKVKIFTRDIEDQNLGGRQGGTTEEHAYQETVLEAIENGFKYQKGDKWSDMDEKTYSQHGAGFEDERMITTGVEAVDETGEMSSSPFSSLPV